MLVDVPFVRGIDWVERGEGVMPDDILAAEERCGFRIEPGDVLLVRTGQLHRRTVEGPVPREAGSTACQAACLPLFKERDIAVLGSDTGNDVSPPQYPGQLTNPVHQVSITAMGLWILDNANLEDVAASVPRTQPVDLHGQHQPAAPPEHHRLSRQSHCGVLAWPVQSRLVSLYRSS